MEGASNDPTFDVSIRREGTGAVIELVGELDLHEAKRLEAAMSDVLADPIVVVDVDARQLTFIDSAGIRSILLARADADSRGITFRLSGVSPAVQRILEIAGAEELMDDGD